MLRKNLILTFAAGPIFELTSTFWRFLESTFELNAEVVILTTDMPQENRDLLANRVRVVDVDKVKMMNLLRDRHLAVYDFLIKEGRNYEKILITDSRDVYFQSDPFEWVGLEGMGSSFLMATQEGQMPNQCPFAMIEQFEFQRNIPRNFLQVGYRFPVVNGGVFLGTPDMLTHWHLLLWTVSLKNIGQCTDQATVNWLWTYVSQDARYRAVGPEEGFCLTGEGVKAGAVTPCWENECYYTASGKKHCMIHQWDRIDTARLPKLPESTKIPDTNESSCKT